MLPYFADDVRDLRQLAASQTLRIQIAKNFMDLSPCNLVSGT